VQHQRWSFEDYITKPPLANLESSVTVIITKMLFSEEDAPLLKKWIVKRLENTYGSFNSSLL
jgi:hypothetical protein